jgi:hypothetical protein
VSVLGIKGKEFGLLQTPTATEIGVRSPEAMKRRIAFRKSIGRNSVPPGNLLEQLQMMYPTPTQDCRAALIDRGKSNLGEEIHQQYNAKKLGGRLNQNFVEFLMGYAQDWTKIEQTELKHSETQSSHKSPLKSEGRLSGRKNNRHEINKKQKV